MALNDEIYPSLNNVYAAFVIVVGAVGGGFMVWAGIFNSSDFGATIIAVGAGLFAAAGSVFIVFRASRVRMDDKGISSSSTRLKWSEVTEVKWVLFGLHFIAGRKKVVIAPYAYKDPGQLLSFAEDAIKRAR